MRDLVVTYDLAMTLHASFLDLVVTLPANL